MEVNRAPYEMLLRVPGIGVKSAKRIMTARRTGSLDFQGLKKIGVVLKRAQYFITCSGKIMEGLSITPDAALRSLISEKCQGMLPQRGAEQLSFFEPDHVLAEDVRKCLTGQI